MSPKPKYRRVNPLKYKEFVIGMLAMTAIIPWMAYDLINHKNFIVVGPLSIVCGFYLQRGLNRMVSDMRVPYDDECREGSSADFSEADK